MAALKAIRNHIIFQFDDEVVRGKGQMFGQGGFKETTEWGFELTFAHHDHQEALNKARKATIVSVGHEAARDFKPGDKIIIEPTMWSTHFMHEGEPYWRTDSTKVIGFWEEAA